MDSSKHLQDLSDANIESDFLEEDSLTEDNDSDDSYKVSDSAQDNVDSYDESSASENELKKKILYRYQPHVATAYRTVGALSKNILSYNVDSFNKHNPKVNAYGVSKMETPVAMLMHHDQSKYDIFLSSEDEDDFTEGDGKTKTIPVKQFVLKSWINP